jgi:hypothetical protein
MYYIALGKERHRFAATMPLKPTQAMNPDADLIGSARFVMGQVGELQFLAEFSARSPIQAGMTAPRSLPVGLGLQRRAQQQ